MVLFVDTSNFNSSVLKRELMENALDEKLRQFADTCSYPLVALYGIYRSNYENHVDSNPDFYIRFLEKWKNEESPYFEEFRKKVPVTVAAEKKNYSILYGLTGLITGLSLMYLLMKGHSAKSHKLIQELTFQERKIFMLLQKERSNKEISDELNISLSTVKTHINNIFSKLNIKSRREASRFQMN